MSKKKKPAKTTAEPTVDPVKNLRQAAFHVASAQVAIAKFVAEEAMFTQYADSQDQFMCNFGKVADLLNQVCRELRYVST